jgi:UDP-N-acetylglucosamine--N-acetylmuramyl-(pentapeptide) pyrophosphoryl-undecaprenol N-acetylglucosamine transferase
MNRPALIMICAGGTGGHLFPAQALASVLREKGLRTILVTDERIGAIADKFPAEKVITVPSATPSRRSPLETLSAIGKLSRGVLVARGLISREKPDVVVGFGGYPTVPPLIAAALMRVPTVVHEQNGVLGRANKLLARFVTHLATSALTVKGIPGSAERKVVRTGNPVRATVIRAAETLYPAAIKGTKIRLLVFGGSQGAKVMSDVVPRAVKLLPPEHLRRIVVTQQAREEDLDRVRQAYAETGAEFEVEPFFRDLPQRIADSHLVISRSGASTVSELAVIGRPSILVPLPGALDQDQAANAKTLADIGAALMLPQKDFTPERLAAELTARFEDPDSLTRAAMAARSAGVPDAAEKLASLVMRLARVAA